MVDNGRGGGFWVSLPGVLTGLAAVIAALVAAYATIWKPEADDSARAAEARSSSSISTSGASEYGGEGNGKNALSQVDQSPARIDRSQPARLLGNVSSMFSDAYPLAARRIDAQGRTIVKLGVDGSGTVESCSVSKSSGNKDLDEASCHIAETRARFSPALGGDGKPIVSTYALPIEWTLPTQ